MHPIGHASEESLSHLQDDQFPELTEPGRHLHVPTVPCKGNPFTRTGTRGIRRAPVTCSTGKNHPTHEQRSGMGSRKLTSPAKAQCPAEKTKSDKEEMQPGHLALDIFIGTQEAPLGVFHGGRSLLPHLYDYTSPICQYCISAVGHLLRIW